MAFLVRVWAYIIAVVGWRGGVQAADEAIAKTSSEVAVDEVVPEKLSEAEKADEPRLDPGGRFWHLEDLLDQIPVCQKLLRRYKKHDRQAYAYHRRVGARLIPRTIGIRVDGLDEAATRLLPSSGMIYCHENWGGRDGVPMFAYFDRVESSIWAAKGQLYRVSLAYWFEGEAYGEPFFVVLPKNGEAFAVPCPVTVRQTIEHRDRGGGVSWIDHHRCVLPRSLVTLFEDHKERRKTEGEEPIENVSAYGGFLFRLIMNIHMTGYGAEQYTILAEKEGITARFDVHLAGPKTFFKDRSTTLASDGRKKRIIHWVKPHDRVLQDGGTVSVKGHFRGNTKFEWHGSKITVLLPKNRFDPRQWNVPSYLEGDMPKDIKTVEPGYIGERIRGRMIEYGRENRMSG